MAIQMAASHAASRRLKDAIFGAAAACRAAVAVHGEERVVNATIGAVMDDAGKLAHLPTVERVFRSLSIEDYIAYAPISGLPEYIWRQLSTSRLPAIALQAISARLQRRVERAHCAPPSITKYKSAIR